MGEGKASSGRVRTFRKLYQFVAQQLLSVRTKAGELKDSKSGLGRFLLEAQLENMGEGAVCFEVRLYFCLGFYFFVLSLVTLSYQVWDFRMQIGKRINSGVPGIVWMRFLLSAASDSGPYFLVWIIYHHSLAHASCSGCVISMILVSLLRLHGTFQGYPHSTAQWNGDAPRLQNRFCGYSV